jgi:hypothetical protein
MTEKKKLSGGKWMGIIAFIHILISITFSQILVVMGYDGDLLTLYKLTGLSFGVFTVVWTAVFGNNAIKKTKGDNYKQAIKSIEVKVEEMQKNAHTE